MILGFIGWEWKIALKNGGKWKKNYIWIKSFPAQIDKFWDTVDWLGNTFTTLLNLLISADLWQSIYKYNLFFIQEQLMTNTDTADAQNKNAAWCNSK